MYNQCQQKNSMPTPANRSFVSTKILTLPNHIILLHYQLKRAFCYSFSIKFYTGANRLLYLRYPVFTSIVGTKRYKSLYFLEPQITLKPHVKNVPQLFYRSTMRFLQGVGMILRGRGIFVALRYGN